MQGITIFTSNSRPLVELTLMLSWRTLVGILARSRTLSSKSTQKFGLNVQLFLLYILWCYLVSTCIPKTKFMFIFFNASNSLVSALGSKSLPIILEPPCITVTYKYFITVTFMLILFMLLANLNIWVNISYFSGHLNPHSPSSDDQNLFCFWHHACIFIKFIL